MCHFLFAFAAAFSRAAPYDTWPRVDAASSGAQLARQERESVNCKQMVSAGGRSLQAGGSGANKVPAVV